MPADLKPCPFCGGEATFVKGENYFVVEHDSWQCPMAAASKEIFQIINVSDSVEWNVRADTNEKKFYSPLRQLTHANSSLSHICPKCQNGTVIFQGDEGACDNSSCDYRNAGKHQLA